MPLRGRHFCVAPDAAEVVTGEAAGVLATSVTALTMELVLVVTAASVLGGGGGGGAAGVVEAGAGVSAGGGAAAAGDDAAGAGVSDGAGAGELEGGGLLFWTGAGVPPMVASMKRLG